MTEQITIQQALELVDFDQYYDGVWFVGTVKGNCRVVEGNCGVVKGDCRTVEGRVVGTINGRQWQYVETSREQVVRLIEEGASKEALLKALEQLDD